MFGLFINSTLMVERINQTKSNQIIVKPELVASLNIICSRPSDRTFTNFKRLFFGWQMIDIVRHLGLFYLADASTLANVFPVMHWLTTRSGGYCVCHLNILHISAKRRQFDCLLRHDQVSDCHRRIILPLLALLYRFFPLATLWQHFNERATNVSSNVGCCAWPRREQRLPNLCGKPPSRHSHKRCWRRFLQIRNHSRYRPQESERRTTVCLHRIWRSQVSAKLAYSMLGPGSPFV